MARAGRAKEAGEETCANYRLFSESIAVKILGVISDT
jgi:hypothetical protein